MIQLSVAIIEDENSLRISLTDHLIKAGYQVFAFENPIIALESIKKNPPHVILSDIKMPDMDGMELLKKVKKFFPNIVVIMMTAYGSVESAVTAMKQGAYDYLTKPFQIDEIIIMFDRIHRMMSLEHSNRQFQEHFQSQFELKALVGKSPAIQHIKEQVKLVARSSATVLITGETGTGKELLANIIHYESIRRGMPLIKVSCAMLSKEIFESELFGHEKGAFTGATSQRQGRFELANSGTLYLDDVDDIPMNLQVKLLRVLEEQEYERVGGNRTIKVDVRVIASTKVGLQEQIKAGKFREDLYYRLNVFPIHLTPLRERKEDIPALIQFFIHEMSAKTEIEVHPQVANALQEYYWPGNVRELKNIVERLYIISNGKDINLSILPPEIFKPDTSAFKLSIGEKSFSEIIKEIEINLIRQSLMKTHGNQARAAELLKINQATFRSKIYKYGLT